MAQIKYYTTFKFHFFNDFKGIKYVKLMIWELGGLVVELQTENGYIFIVLSPLSPSIPETSCSKLCSLRSSLTPQFVK